MLWSKMILNIIAPINVCLSVGFPVDYATLGFFLPERIIANNYFNRFCRFWVSVINKKRVG